MPNKSCFYLPVWPYGDILEFKPVLNKKMPRNFLNKIPIIIMYLITLTLITEFDMLVGEVVGRLVGG